MNNLPTNDYYFIDFVTEPLSSEATHAIDVIFGNSPGTKTRASLQKFMLTLSRMERDPTPG